ncbi:SMI1/KNR4 family protein [Streptomyces nondiastaticus]|uniref:SMI1/KNR4 family protein n=1 Tax=Streptomyces nondiastaticus TaxID=3154512 RepID=UPI0034487FAA
MSSSDTSVRSSWARIDAWLRAQAPATFAVLAGPADPDGIEAAQTEMGVRFPSDLLDSLACHDGVTSWKTVLPVQSPLSAKGIAEFWSLNESIAGSDRDLREANEDEGEDEPWWHRDWIPWAASDGDAQVIDVRDGVHWGRLGTTAHDGTGCFRDGWPSLAAYLCEVADALEFGGDVYGLVPYLLPGGELWWDLPGETRLNGAPLAPAPTTHVR